MGFLRFKERVTKARSLSMDNFGVEIISAVGLKRRAINCLKPSDDDGDTLNCDFNC